MQYIEPGSTSQSLVMYLQDAVTGGAYVTEDQADWTFNFIREGDSSATADASITAGTLGTWADGTAKPFSTTGEWQIDFADAAFAAGVGYVKLLVTHDTDLFLPKSVHVDMAVASAVQVGASVVEFPDAGRMMAGASESNTYAKLAANDDDYWSCTDPDASNPLEMCVYVNAASGTFPDAVVVDARYNAQNNRRVHLFAANVDDVAAISDEAATATDASPSVLTHSVAGSFADLTLAGYDIYITSGTNATAGFYTIASHTDDVITLDRNCSSNGAVSSIDFIVMVWDQISNDTNAILHKTGADGDYEYPLGVSYMTTDNNEVFLRFSDEGQSQFKTTYDFRLDLVGVITKSLVGGSVSAETYAAAVHTELDDHFRHMPSFTGEVFYVSTTGGDSNSGHDPASPLLTITAAIAAASAGDYIKVKAGTYAEAVTLAANGLELHCEIGTNITGASGVPLTITANDCKVLGAHLIPADGQIGCVISGDYNYMETCQSRTTGTSGWQITTAGAGNEFVDCVAENFTGAGWDIKGPNNIFHLCLAVGEGGSETGFHLSHTAAHRNMFDNCSTVDCATAGWDCDVGADDNLFHFCSDSDGCGAKVDAGTNNAWRGFQDTDDNEIEGVSATNLAKFEDMLDGTGGTGLYLDAMTITGAATGISVSGTTAGVHIDGGVTGIGLDIDAGSEGGVAVDIDTASGDAVTIVTGAGSGVVIDGDDVNAAVHIENAHASGHAVKLYADGAGAGLFLASNTGADLQLGGGGAMTGNITGNLSGSVGSVTGAVGSVGTGGITATSIADAAIDNATFAADVHSTTYSSNIIAQAVNNALAQNNLDHLMKVALSGAASPTYAEIVDRTALSWLLTQTGDSSDFVASTDSLEALQTGTAGAGACEHVHTTNISGVAKPGAEVWITSDVAGTTIIAGPQTSDGSGETTWWLDAGTAYAWQQLAGNQWDNPETITVS